MSVVFSQRSLYWFYDTLLRKKLGLLVFFKEIRGNGEEKQTDDPFWPPKEQRKTRTERRQHTGDVLSICKANTHLQIYTNAF